MDEETANLVKENIRLTQENNRLLKKLWKTSLLSFWSKILFVIIIIGIPVLIYQYYLSDVLHEIRSTYKGMLEDIGTIKEIPEKMSVSAVIESLEERKRGVIE